MTSQDKLDILATKSLSDTLDNKEDLLSQSKLKWFYGDWEGLVNLAFEKIEAHPQKESLALIVGSAYQQLNNFSMAKKYLTHAKQWGADEKSIAKVCIADASNTLGRIALLQNNDDKAEKSFLNAVDLGEKQDIELIAHSRSIREMAKLGLLPQAANLIDSRLKAIKESPAEIKNISAQTKVLETEVELLLHELNISLQRNQLYKTSSQNSERQKPLEVGSEKYIEYVESISTSQLGQDLWVLQQTNFKKHGFFVEFGATDGVLLSNSFVLEKEFEWNGICAEPNPSFFSKLEKNRDCIVSNECIGAETGEKINFVFAQEYGGMQKHIAHDMHEDKRQAYLDQGFSIELETISLHDFLTKHNAPRIIDYLSIDTEGSEFEILQNFPFEHWDIRLLTVEHNFTEQRELIYSLLSSKGYKRQECSFDDWYFKD